MKIIDRSQLELELEYDNVNLICLKWSCADLERQLKKAKSKGEANELAYFLHEEEEERKELKRKRDGIKELLELGISLLVVGGK